MSSSYEGVYYGPREPVLGAFGPCVLVPGYACDETSAGPKSHWTLPEPWTSPVLLLVHCPHTLECTHHMFTKHTGSLLSTANRTLCPHAFGKWQHVPLTPRLYTQRSTLPHIQKRTPVLGYSLM
jgi:hypothetical protein